MSEVTLPCDVAGISVSEDAGEVVVSGTGRLNFRDVQVLLDAIQAASTVAAVSRQAAYDALPKCPSCGEPLNEAGRCQSRPSYCVFANQVPAVLKTWEELMAELARLQPERFGDAPIAVHFVEGNGFEGHDHVGNEVYGHKAMVYVGALPGTRLALEDALVTAGFIVARDYNPSSDTLEVQVGYFRGWHWDE